MKAALTALRGTVLLVLLLSAGCAGQQSALEPRGPEAAHLAQLFWVFTATCGAIWIMVIIALGVAISRQSRDADRSGHGPLALDQNRERKTAFIVGALVTATTAILIVFTILSYFATRTLAASGDTLNIEVTAHQWWWEVTYSDEEPSRVFQTANEIHVPVGRPVKFTLKAADVIHSFWIPNLGGKQDLIPGQVNTIAFTPDRHRHLSRSMRRVLRSAARPYGSLCGRPERARFRVLASGPASVCPFAQYARASYWAAGLF